MLYAPSWWCIWHPCGGICRPWWYICSLVVSQAVTRVRLRRALCSLSGGLSGGMRACVPDTVSTHKLRLASSGEGILPSYREREHIAPGAPYATTECLQRAPRESNTCHVPPPDTTRWHPHTCIPYITPPHHQITGSKEGPKEGPFRAKKGSKRGHFRGQFGGPEPPTDPLRPLIWGPTDPGSGSTDHL